jgi:uncharacterized membrane protein
VNFRKLYRFALVFFLLIVFQGNATAATIHGTVYEWSTFKPLNNSVVEINSTPEQNVIAKDSEYSFNLTPGTYAINASYIEGNKVIYKAQDEVVISREGDYVHDLLMFPPSNEELLNQDQMDVPNLDYESAEPVSQPNYQYTVLVSFLALTVLLLGVYLLKKRHDKSGTVLISEVKKEPHQLEHENSEEDEISYEESEVDSTEKTVENSELSSEQCDVNLDEAPDTNKSLQQKNKSTEEVQDLQESSFHEKVPNKSIHRTKEHSKFNLSEDFKDLLESLHEKELNKSSSEAKEHSKLNLPEDLKDLLELIKDSGNRITQRELRKKSPYSESKVSLMLSDLEERGLIEKFKKGRGNIIRIPDVHIARQKKQEHKKE